MMLGLLGARSGEMITSKLDLLQTLAPFPPFFLPFSKNGMTQKNELPKTKFGLL